MHWRLVNATLSQLSFPGESNLNFSREKCQWDNAIVKKEKKKCVRPLSLYITWVCEYWKKRCDIYTSWSSDHTKYFNKCPLTEQARNLCFHHQSELLEKTRFTSMQLVLCLHTDRNPDNSLSYSLYQLPCVPSLIICQVENEEEERKYLYVLQYPYTLVILKKCQSTKVTYEYFLPHYFHKKYFALTQTPPPPYSVNSMSTVSILHQQHQHHR